MSSNHSCSAEVSQEADQGSIKPGVSANSMEAALSGNGFSYRHDWGRLRGQQKLRLNTSAINARSHVFVSIGEGVAGDPANGKFIGAARFTVHNVAPRAGGVDIWVNIEWGSDIPLYVDYLVINPPGARTVRVTVHRHPTVPMSNAEADRILNDMGEALQNSDSSADVATQVRFVRDGAVRILPATIPATIQTQAHSNALFAAGTGVKVVRNIMWCGGPGGSIIGCAPVGSPVVNIGVVPFTANQEGILWAHEYGHNTGSGHRTDDGRALMFPSIGSDHNVVNSTESGRFMTGPLAINRGISAMKSSCGHGETPKAPDDVLEFVSQHWIEGIPRDVASQFTEEDAKRLLDWLVNEPENHEEFLPEIVTTLGFIGNEMAVQPLIDFVESQKGSSQAIFKAKNAALIHLGDLARQSGSQAAISFLTRVAGDMKAANSFSAPEASRMAAADNTATPATDELAAELAVSATMGLSKVGTGKAKQVLESLVSDPQTFAAVNQAASEMVDRAKFGD